MISPMPESTSRIEKMIANGDKVIPYLIRLSHTNRQLWQSANHNSSSYFTSKEPAVISSGTAIPIISNSVGEMFARIPRVSLSE